ncbi:Oxo-4-hydroxy-4-carboxy-5-ureidoimidazoline decarboxylase [Pterulicium gracile]|uniref:Oxo-4-hydroxy-4-carboxy-5-ureidoimidazoline decarboxylase n=1 Tax=Pterulicium gracile TaxID=1884261 RepID=A0A5C3R3L8_9AGAR|nr:Oxo-4-hydroxy-4-carboxy-5-ureidoimidazoline decarboxylase [Pterula gracilis]
MDAASNTKTDTSRRHNLDPYDSLVAALTLLFEHSPLIGSHLAPQIIPSLYTEINDYNALLSRAIQVIGSWPVQLKATFIAAHPRIGETKNLSALSAAEQQQSPPSQAQQPKTSPEVLEALRILNECYEIKYQGLVYITFVNGRSRSEVAEEMRLKLGVEGVQGDQDKIRAAEKVGKESEEWIQELDRAVRDVGLIASSRLDKIPRTSLALPFTRSHDRVSAE